MLVRCFFLLDVDKMLQACVAFASCYLLDVACCILKCCMQELFWDYDCHAATTFFVRAFCIFFHAAKNDLGADFVAECCCGAIYFP